MDDASVSPDRMIILTDGVIAIALTLLVLDLTSINTTTSSAGTLWRTLVDERDRFIAYLIAYWVIAQFWLLHHRIFRRVLRHDDVLAARNLWFVFGISLLPFTTRLLGETKDNPLAVTLFSANLLLIGCSLMWITATATRAGVMVAGSERQLRLQRVRGITTSILFVLPAVFAWIIDPGQAELLFLLLYLADVPGRLIERRHGRRPSKATAAQ